MFLPLDLWQISLWLAVMAIILYIASELISTKYGFIKIYINKKKLRKVTFIMSLLFLATVIMRVAILLFMPESLSI